MGKKVKGYKAFNPDWTCQDYQYSCPGVFEMDKKPKMCSRGFHFCQEITDCFKYYSFDPNTKIAEVEALGKVEFSDDDSKCCTNKLSIIRELSWEEVLDLSNAGKKCYGYGNSGSCNEGNFNTGDGNVGKANTGDFNNGFRNSGHQNSGDRNTGNRNLGDFNTGDYNTGNFNTGDWNAASFCSGCFMTEDQPFFMFNRPTKMTYDQWFASDAAEILRGLCSSPVDNTGKINGRSLCLHSEITGVNLIEVDQKENIQEKWNALKEEDKQCVMDLPNFDRYIFYECTGIKVD